jgi:hypothetical protein
MAAGAIEGGKAVRTAWREWRDFSVSLSSDDPAYQDVQDWLIDNVPTSRRHALSVYSRAPRSEYDDVLEQPENPGALRVVYDSAKEQEIRVGEHRVKVSLREADTQDGRRAPDKLVFRCTNEPAQRAVTERLRAIVEARRESARKSQLWTLDSWGHWERRTEVSPRPLESVVLPAGQMEALTADLTAFLSQEAEYAHRGMPWHRGYLLEGPPGTGKTSIVTALAHHFKMDLWYAPLGDLSKDAKLLALCAEVRPRSILLLEDIDIYHAATTRDSDKEMATLSGLLNALDGVSTPHGLVTVMTSNKPDVLDEALIRPGRIDRREHIGHIVQEQAERLFAHFYGRPPAESWKVADDLSPAYLTELFKRHLHDPAGAERELAATD